MTATASGALNMAMFFNRKKTKQLEIEKEIARLKVEKEREIAKIKENAAARSEDARQSLEKLNELVETHGASGILFSIMGGIKK